MGSPSFVQPPDIGICLFHVKKVSVDVSSVSVMLILILIVDILSVFHLTTAKYQATRWSIPEPEGRWKEIP